MQSYTKQSSNTHVTKMWGSCPIHTTAMRPTQKLLHIHRPTYAPPNTPNWHSPVHHNHQSGQSKPARRFGANATCSGTYTQPAAAATCCLVVQPSQRKWHVSFVLHSVCTASAAPLGPTSSNVGCCSRRSSSKPSRQEAHRQGSQARHHGHAHSGAAEPDTSDQRPHAT